MSGTHVLVELRLENYAVIDNVTVGFASGLNLLTGETGAGKSILIDALALLLGDKASIGVIRAGTDRALIGAVFALDPSSFRFVHQILEGHGIDSEDDSIILRREIFAGGKGRVFVNNQPATVAVLRQLGPHLATIHAQNESLLHFDAAARLQLLDSFACTTLEPTVDAFHGWKSIGARIEELERDEHDRLRLLDLWSFQKREIDDAKLTPGEDERLEAEKLILGNAEKIHGASIVAFDLLYEGDTSAAYSLRGAQKHLEDLCRYEPKFRDALAALDSARISVEDVGATLRDYAGSIQSSPERLAEIEDRLAAMSRLKRKYGESVDQIIEFGAEVTRKLSEMENRDEVFRQLRGEQARAAEEYVRAAREVSRKRSAAARQLESLVETEINELAMKSKIRLEVRGSEEETNWGSSGFDEVEYLIATNPGEPLRPLDQVASGGELSRVMLALKVSLESGKGRKAASGRTPSPTNAGPNNSLQPDRTLVFDEIDIGIGGRAAEAVGKKLKSLALRNQILCVTHLPQIAAFADHHFLIEKDEIAGSTRTSIREISGEERTEEVARMLSGAKLTETSRKHAQQMLKLDA